MKPARELIALVQTLLHGLESQATKTHLQNRS